MRVRVTAVVVVDGRVLLLKQDTGSGRSWSLPGGKVDPGETVREALVREMREETGLDVEMGRLLYVCDHPAAEMLHLTFETRVLGGRLGQIAGTDTRPIEAVEFVPVAELPEYGFTTRFRDLVAEGFPGAGSYLGLKANIGL